MQQNAAIAPAPRDVAHYKPTRATRHTVHVHHLVAHAPTGSQPHASSLSKALRPYPPSCAVRDSTVAGSCRGSPTRTHCRSDGKRAKMTAASASGSCAASSTTTHGTCGLMRVRGWEPTADTVQKITRAEERRKLGEGVPGGGGKRVGGSVCIGVEKGVRREVGYNLCAGERSDLVQRRR